MYRWAPQRQHAWVTKGRTDPFSLLPSFSLVLLVFLNMMLFYKLWMLEYSAQSLTTWQGLRLHERYTHTHTQVYTKQRIFMTELIYLRDTISDILEYKQNVICHGGDETEWSSVWLFAQKAVTTPQIQLLTRSHAKPRPYGRWRVWHGASKITPWIAPGRVKLVGSPSERKTCSSGCALMLLMCVHVRFPVNCLRRRWSGPSSWRRSSVSMTPSCRSGGRLSSRRSCCSTRYSGREDTLWHSCQDRGVTPRECVCVMGDSAYVNRNRTVCIYWLFSEGHTQHTINIQQVILAREPFCWVQHFMILLTVSTIVAP